MDKEASEIHGEEAGNRRAFDLKSVLILVSRNNLGESHLLPRITPILDHVLGCDSLSSAEDPEEFQRLVDQAREIVLDQQPDLSVVVDDLAELRDERFLDSLAATDLPVTLLSPRSQET